MNIKPGFFFLLSLFLPFIAQANQEGLWTTTTKPGYSFVILEGDVNSQETAGMIVLYPEQTKWEIFFGEDSYNFTTFKNTVKLEPLFTPSDMKATWVADDKNAMLTVDSCSKSCLWNPGQQVAFTKLYGEGVNLGGSASDDGGSDGDSGGDNSEIAGMWADAGENSDGSTFQTCFNVSKDGKKLTSAGSECEDGNALDIEIDGLKDNSGDNCDINIGYEQDIPIVNGEFSVENWNPPFAPEIIRLTVKGTISGNSATGTLVEVNDFPEVCPQGTWTAVPRLSNTEPEFSSCKIANVCSQLSFSNCKAAGGIYMGNVPCP